MRTGRRRGGAPAGPGTGGDLQTAVLEDLRGARNYRAWLADLTAPYLGDDPLEVGSGLGDYAAEWAARGLRVTATDADPDRVALLRQRFAGDERVTVRRLAVPIEATADHSAVVALNVLEHILDDVGALASMARLVAPGGHVVIVVPAFPVAMSAFDRAIGHVRRYRRAGLRRAAESAGLVVERLRYLNAPGLIGWVVVVRLLRGRPRQGLALRAFDAVVPLLRRIEAVVPPPFGQSLLLVARTPPTS